MGKLLFGFSVLLRKVSNISGIRNRYQRIIPGSDPGFSADNKNRQITEPFAYCEFISISRASICSMFNSAIFIY